MVGSYILSAYWYGGFIMGYKYVVWVGGCDDYYNDLNKAREHYNEWIEQGYDDVYLLHNLENEDGI